MSKDISIKDVDWNFNDKVIFDIETIYDIKRIRDNNTIIAIGFYNRDMDEFLFMHLDEYENRDAFYKAIKHFFQYLFQTEVLLIGWNSLYFDYPRICSECGLKNPTIDSKWSHKRIGYGNKPFEYKAFNALFGYKKETVNYLHQHIDAMLFIFKHFKQYNFASYSLKNVGNDLGLNKGEAKIGIDVMPHVLYEDPDQRQLFFDYLRQDLVAVDNIMVKLEAYGLIESLMRISKVNYPTDLLSTSKLCTAALESHGIEEFGIGGDNELLNKGGLNLLSDGGIYKDVEVFDFKSQYPTIMKDLQVSKPLTKAIEDMMLERAKYKAMGDKNSEQAIKIVMNSIYGSFGNKFFKYASSNFAALITYIGRVLIQGAAILAEKHDGFVVMTSTDSVFVNWPNGRFKDYRVLVDSFSKYVLNYFRNELVEDHINTIMDCKNFDAEETADSLVNSFLDSDYKLEETGFFEFEGFYKYVVKQKEAKQYVKFDSELNYEVIGSLKSKSLNPVVMEIIIEYMKQYLEGNDPKLDKIIDNTITSGEQLVNIKTCPKSFNVDGGGTLAKGFRDSKNMLEHGDKYMLINGLGYNMDNTKNTNKFNGKYSDSWLRKSKVELAEDCEKKLMKFGIKLIKDQSFNFS
ncbi:MAG: DNA polymerase II [Methanobrevibacter sp. CfCl-M3]